MMRSMDYQPVPAVTLCKVRRYRRLRTGGVIPPTDPAWPRGFRLVRAPGKRVVDVVTSSRQVLTDDPVAIPQVSTHGPAVGIPGAGPILPVAPTSSLATPVPGSGVFVSPTPTPWPMPPQVSDPFDPFDADTLTPGDPITGPDAATLKRIASWKRRLKVVMRSLSRHKVRIAAMRKKKAHAKNKVAYYKKVGNSDLLARWRIKHKRYYANIKRYNKTLAKYRTEIRKLRAKIKQPAAVAGLSGFEALSDLGMIGDSYVDVGPIESMALNGLPDELDPDLAGFLDSLKDFGQKLLDQAVPAAAQAFFPQQYRNVQAIQAQRMMSGNSREAERLLKAERSAIRKLNKQMSALTQKMKIDQARSKERSSAMRRLLPIGLAAGAVAIVGLTLITRRKR